MIDEDCELIDLTLDDEPDFFLDLLEDASIFNLENLPANTHFRFSQHADSSVPVSAATAATTVPDSVPVEPPYAAITSADDLAILKDGLKHIDLRPRECLSFKKYPNTIVVELDDMFCQRPQRKHSSNRAFVVISATMVVRKCSSPQCKVLPESSVKTAMGVFPSDFRSVVKRLLLEESHMPQQQVPSETVSETVPEAQTDRPVSAVIAQERFAYHNDMFPGSAQLECVRKNNILVSKVVKDSTGDVMTELDAILRVKHDPFCKGTQFAQTSTQGLAIVCDACAFRFPQRDSAFMVVSEKQFPSLCSFLVQVNNNTTNITVNNYNADSLQLDVQFNQIEPIFPDDDFNLVMFKSFNARAGDIAAAVYHMGKNLFGVVPKKDAVEWWGWDARLSKWTAEKHFVEYFCMTTMVAYYEQAQQYFRLHTADPTLAKNRDIRFEQICKRLNDRELVHIVNSKDYLLCAENAS
ncbi:hypothetical protein HDU80_011702 [Chytriomyces hyalinus]|nr:hypothetical protein HDU80_011702 [Chytriomyces hyalinus]